MKPLQRPTRRTLLVLHVAVSVSWLGLSLGLLALGTAGYTAHDPTTTQAAYRSMRVFTDWLMVPIGLTTFISGLVLSLGTPWGLARRHWVWIKFWLTLVTLTATTFALRPSVHEAAALGEPNSSLIAAPIVSSTAYLFMTAISVLKPWGLTRRGRRLKAQEAQKAHEARGTEGPKAARGTRGALQPR
ncbi:DUF2269 domain-containing protein [Streptomyces sp. NPDC093085]|uniref:DUF2269 domain-containing protein n=1 Tax=Streptomyces sp. NPDC093085 TaxID=3155068 RepID=UPI0034226D87